MSISPEQADAVLNRAECIYDRARIDEALDRMAQEIKGKLEGHNPLLLCLLTGGLIATGELLLRLDFPLELDYLDASRYGNHTSGTKLKWYARPRKDIKGRDVIVVDDILDEGQTLHEIVAYCKEEGVKSIHTAVLVEKEHDRKFGSVKADIVGLPVPDRYVFGFGMDYKGYLRNVAGIYAAHKDDE